MNWVEIIIELVLLAFLLDEVYRYLVHSYAWKSVSNLDNQYRINEYAGRFHFNH